MINQYEVPAAIGELFDLIREVHLIWKEKTKDHATDKK